MYDRPHCTLCRKKVAFDLRQDSLIGTFLIGSPDEQNASCCTHNIHRTNATVQCFLPDCLVHMMNDDNRTTLFLCDVNQRSNIIDGSHSHKHMDKEEYALVTEKEKVSTAASKVNAGMRQLVQSQDDFKEFLKKNKDGRLFAEVQSLKAQSEKYSDMLTADSKRLAEYWSEYRSASSEFFAEYRIKKNELWSEIASTRKESRANEKKIQSLLDSIIYDSDLLIIKLIKLMSLLCHLIKGTALDAEIAALQEANAAVKAEAKKVMALSNGIAGELRSKEHTALEEALTEYENQLVHSMESIENTIRWNLDLQR